MFVLIFWICFGALVGWTISLVQGPHDMHAIVRYSALGVLGGLIGGWGSNWVIGMGGNSHSNDLTSMMFAIVGAVIIVISLATAYNRRSQ